MLVFHVKFFVCVQFVGCCSCLLDSNAFTLRQTKDSIKFGRLGRLKSYDNSLRASETNEGAQPKFTTRVPFNLTAVNMLQPSFRSRDISSNTAITFSGPSSFQVSLKWEGPPKRVLVVSKPDVEINKAVDASVKYLRRMGLEVVVEDRIYDYLQRCSMISTSFKLPAEAPIAFDDCSIEDDEAKPLAPLIRFHHCESMTEGLDLVICFGGDGLIMHTNTLFGDHSVPPVLCFDFGSLGFLSPFPFDEFRKSVDRLLEGEVQLTLRMRLQCTIRRAGRLCGTYLVLNEAVLDRGPSPYLCNLDLFCDNQFLTTVQADGLIVATPTGSTAYSLSAGGSMVHPSVPALLVTPICAHTLSFRPLLLPDSCALRCTIPFEGRGTAWVSFDGKFRQELQAGDSLEVRMSPYPMPTVNRLNFTADWFESLRHAFMFNQRPRQKPFGFTESSLEF